MVFAHMLYGFCRIWFKSKNDLKSESEFANTFGILIDDIRIESKAQRLYYFFFILRRLLYLSLLFNYLSLTTTLQMLIIMLINLMNIIYLGIFEPKEARMDRRIEIANDTAIAMCFISMLTMTDWASSPEQKFRNTWLVILFIEITIAFNFVNVIHKIYVSFKLLIIKYSKRVWRFIERKLNLDLGINKTRLVSEATI